MINPNVADKSGTGNLEAKVRELVGEAISRARKAGKSRADIAREMADSLDCSVTEDMLYEFTRSLQPRRELRFPAGWVPAFCGATGDWSLAVFVCSEEMRSDLEIGKWARESRWILERVRAEIPRLPKPKSPPSLKRKR
jgi:hypothetical protein